MKVYSVERPIAPGTYPEDQFYKVVDLVNFEKPIFIPEVGRKVWGVLTYENPVPEKKLQEYDLVAQEYEIIHTWKELVRVHNLSREAKKTPADTVCFLLKKVSTRTLQGTLAAYVQLKPHDGRIDAKSRKYLSPYFVDDALIEWSSDNPLIRMGLDDIHPTHVDQIIRALMDTAKD